MSERNTLHSIESARLANGRRISFSALGSPRGFPVLYMHGSIGSPLRRTPEMDAAIEANDIRYLMVDRPGFRGSDPLPGRSVLDFASDIEELADGLGFERFSIVGVSAGAPYALACAHRLGDRLAATITVTPVTPFHAVHRTPGAGIRFRMPLAVLSTAPWLIRGIGRGIRALVNHHPGLVMRAMALGASHADRELLANPVDREAAAARFAEAMRGGADPMIEDYLACSRPWGFDLSEVGEPVRIWHGADDKLVPLRDVRRLAEELPVATLEVDDVGGHFLYKNRITEILAATCRRNEDPALRKKAA